MIKFVTFWMGFFALLAILCFPALLNRGAIWFDDSVEYVKSGNAVWTGQDPAFFGQRSIFYSAMIQLLHWNMSSFPIAVFQSIIVITNSFLFVRLMRPGQRLALTWLTLLLAFLMTGVCIYCSLLMPDVLAGVVVLATVSLLHANDEMFDPFERCWLVASLYIAIMSHASNFVLFGSILLSSAAANLATRQCLQLQKTMLVIAVGGFAVLNSCLIHLVVYDRFTLANPTQPPFLLARILADEPGNSYLRTHSTKHDWQISKFGSNLPRDSGAILWSQHGFWMTASPTERQVIKKQAPEVIRTVVLSDPLTQMGSSFENIAILLMRPVDRRLLRSQPLVHDMSRSLNLPIGTEYDQTEQAAGGLKLEWWRTVHAYAYWVTLLLACCCLYFRFERVQLLTVLGAVLCNAAFTACVSGPFSRYHERVAWVLSLMVLCIISKAMEGKFAKDTSKATSLLPS